MNLKRGILLVLFLTIGIVLLYVSSELFGKTEYRIVGRYVDYDCRPVPHARYEFRAFMSSGFPYGGGAQRRHTGLTDDIGLFVVAFESTWSLDRFEIALSQQADERQGRRDFDPVESAVALRSTQSAPVYIYREFPSMIERRTTGRREFLLRYDADGGSWRHTVRQHTSEQRVFLDAGLRWQREGDIWLLTLTAHRRGGFIEHPFDQLPFEADLPSKGYRKSAQMSLPGIDDPTVSKAYYYRHDDGSAYGTLIISARHAEQTGRSVLVSLDHDLLLNDMSSTAAPVLPPYTCRGTVARGYGGSPATASSTARALALQPAIPTSSWAQVALDPDTPRDWFEIRLDDPEVLRNAVASYGEVSERYPLIYRGSRDWFRARLDDETMSRRIYWHNNLIVGLAGDERAPPDILTSIERDFPIVPVVRALSANPNMPRDAIGRLVDGLLNGRYESVERAGETKQTMTTLATIRRLDPGTFQKVSAHLLNARAKREDLGWAAKYFLSNPAVPASILSTWTDHAIEHDEVWMLQHLFTHANTDAGDLRRLGERFFRDEYRPRLSRLSQLFRRQNVPHDVLARYVEVFLAGHVTREACLALAHPNFDREVLYGMLTLENPSLVKKLLGVVSYPRSPPLNVSVKQHHVPAHVIRHIYDLPGAEIFHTHIAANFNTPADILDALLERGSVDRALITNHSLSERQVRKLRDRVTPQYARHKLAQNPATPDDILEEISQQDPPVVSLVRNPSTPPRVLRALYPEAFQLGQRREQLVKDLLKHPRITSDLMEEVLLGEEEAELVRIAATNPATHASIIEKIAAGEYADFFFETSNVSLREIEDALAHNPTTPWHVKRKLRRY